MTRAAAGARNRLNEAAYRGCLSEVRIQYCKARSEKEHRANPRLDLYRAPKDGYAEKTTENEFHR